MNQLAPPLILRRAVIIRRENDGRVEWGVFTGFYLQQIARSVWNFGGVSTPGSLQPGSGSRSYAGQKIPRLTSSIYSGDELFLGDKSRRHLAYKDFDDNGATPSEELASWSDRASESIDYVWDGEDIAYDAKPSDRSDMLREVDSAWKLERQLNDPMPVASPTTRPMLGKKISGRDYSGGGFAMNARYKQDSLRSDIDAVEIGSRGW